MALRWYHWYLNPLTYVSGYVGFSREPNIEISSDPKRILYGKPTIVIPSFDYSFFYRVRNHFLD